MLQTTKLSELIGSLLLGIILTKIKVTRRQLTDLLLLATLMRFYPTKKRAKFMMQLAKMESGVTQHNIAKDKMTYFHNFSGVDSEILGGKIPVRKL